MNNIEKIPGINFTGAQGTGKTTILNELRLRFSDDVLFNTNVVRDLARTKQIYINEYGEDEGQMIIFDAYNEFLDTNEDCYVSDRCVIDPLAYTVHLFEIGRVSSDEMDRQLLKTRELVKSGKLKKVYFFPVEFELVSDGVRSSDPNFQKTIDKIFKDVLDMLKVDGLEVIEVKGTVQERVDIILNDILK